MNQTFAELPIIAKTSNLLTTRIAPTPSGFLHIGNVYSFLLTWLIARKLGGKILLRIDDLDSKRVRTAFLEDIFETLEYLGINYDEGPTGTADFWEHYSQQHRTHRYQAILQKLADTGLVYACTCSRKQIGSALTKENFRHGCRYNQLTLDTPGAAWRIEVPHDTIIKFHDDYRGETIVNLGKQMPDFILRKKDGMASYQVASLSDDIDWNVNYIVRGDDLLASSAAQIYLAGLIDKSLFSNMSFLHHPLMQNDSGAKLSKSAGSQSIQNLRKSGATGTDIFDVLKGLPGIPVDAKASGIHELLESFTLTIISNPQNGHR